MFLRRRKIRIEIEQTTLRLETQRTGEVAKATESAATLFSPLPPPFQILQSAVHTRLHQGRTPVNNLAPGFLRFVNRMLPYRLLTLLAVTILMTGCAMKSTSTSPLVLQGRMKGGQQPVSGATIQLYAVGTTGDASDATPLLTNPVTTDQNGNFSLSTATTKDYVCPTPTTLVYLVGTGGNPGLAAGTNNQGIALMSVLGQCGSLTNSTSLVVNEVTTVGAAAALYPYMSSYSDQKNGYTGFGYGASDASKFAAAFALVNEYVDIAAGASPGPAIPTGYDPSTAALNTLANILSTLHQLHRFQFLP